MKIFDDALLIKKYKKGDSGAFDEIVERYSDMVYNTVYFRVRSKEDAEDLTQETFLKLWKSLSSFREESKLSTFIYRIAVNTCIDHARKKAGKDTDSLSLYEENGEYSGQLDVPADDPSAMPEKAALDREIRDGVNDGIASLSDEGREVIVLRDVLGYSYTDIAEKLGVPEGTVKSRLVRARLALKKYLTERNFSYGISSNDTDGDKNE